MSECTKVPRAEPGKQASHFLQGRSARKSPSSLTALALGETPWSSLMGYTQRMIEMPGNCRAGESLAIPTTKERHTRVTDTVPISTS